MRRNRLKKSSVRLARLSQVARGRHQAVGRIDEATKDREQRIRRMRVSAPKVDARGVVAGTLVAAI
jgi:hypothetical protein